MDRFSSTGEDSPSPTIGDAEQASAAIEPWLKSRSPAPDWEGCLSKIQEALTTLSGLPFVTTDPVARAIFNSLPMMQNVEELAAATDRLAARVAELLPAKAPDAAASMPEAVMTPEDAMTPEAHAADGPATDAKPSLPLVDEPPPPPHRSGRRSLFGPSEARSATRKSDPRDLEPASEAGRKVFRL